MIIRKLLPCQLKGNLMSVKIRFITSHKRELINKDGEEKLIKTVIPIGCIAISGDKWNVSFCRKDERWKRENGRSLAIGRLLRKEKIIPNKKIYTPDYKKINLKDYIEEIVSLEKKRIIERKSSKKSPSSSKKTKKTKKTKN